MCLSAQYVQFDQPRLMVESPANQTMNLGRNTRQMEAAIIDE
jgi:hypothetical protein